MRTYLLALILPIIVASIGCEGGGTGSTNDGNSGGQGGQAQGGGGSGGAIGGSLSLDTSYGDEGIARISRARSYDHMRAAALTADGGILLGGSTDAMAGAWAAEPLLAKFTSTGEPDATFGDGGFVAYPLGTRGQVTSIETSPEGGAWIAGTAERWSRRVAFVARINAQGALDTTFGTGGLTMVEGGSSDEFALISRLPSGDIALLARAPKSSDLALWQLGPNGQVNTSFGNDGRVEIYVSGDEARDLLVDANGKLLALVANSSYGTLYRINAEGSVDTSFGTNGEVNVPFVPYDLEGNANGEWLVAGEESAGKLMKLDANGVPVANFGTNGIVDVVSDSIAFAKWLSNGDMLVVDADSGNYPLRRFLGMKRLGPDGMPVAFDTTGTQAIVFKTNLAAMLLKDDQAFLAGTYNVASGSAGVIETMAFAVNGDGTAVSTYGKSGLAQKGSLRSSDILWTMARASDDSLIASGISGGRAVTRFASGKQDLGFGTNGFLDMSLSVPMDLALDSMNRIILTEFLSYLTRYSFTGMLDMTFGMQGKATIDQSILLSVNVDSKQRIVAGGRIMNTDAMIARLLDDGSLDPAFGTAGIVTNPAGIADYPLVNDVLTDTAGKIVAVGQHDPPTGREGFVVRVLEDGSTDASFGTAGLTLIPVHTIRPTIIERQSGGYLVASVDFDCSGKTECPIAVVALDKDGKLDAGFGVMGITRVEGATFYEMPTGLVELPDGSIVVTGATEENFTEKFAVWKLGKDGTVDSAGPTVLPGKGHATSAVVQGNGVLVGGWAFHPQTGTDMVTLRLLF